MENGKHIQALDGLRGFACLMVIFSHAGNRGVFFKITLAGQLGVMLFFALSGFLMAYLYGNQAFSFKVWLGYAIKRFFRVYPAYLFTITLAFLVVSVTSLPFYGMDAPAYLKHVLLLGTNNVLWTVPVEMRFYLWFPILAILLFFFHNQEKLRLGILAGLWIVLLVFDIPGPQYSVWPYIEFFVTGVFVGYVYLYMEKHQPAARSWRGWGWVAAVCLAGVIYAIPNFSHFYEVEAEIWAASWALAPLMGLTVLAVANAQGVIGWVMGSSPARFLGKISFSLYLLHNRIVGEANSLPTFFPAAVKLLIVLAVSILAAVAVYTVVENPSRRWGKRLAKRVTEGRPHKDLQPGTSAS